MLDYDQCNSIHTARTIARELGVDPRRRGTARLASQLAAMVESDQPATAPTTAVEAPETRLPGDGFTLIRRATLAVLASRSEPPEVIVPRRALPANMSRTRPDTAPTEPTEEDILGPVE